jgi:DNA-binding response OmpR family regulator
MSNASKIREILIIDDDVDSINIIKKQLNTQGYSVTTATTTDEGLSNMHSKIPHLIILDIVLNHESSLTFLKSKMSSDFFKNIPLLAISATKNQRLLSTILASGANDFIQKPLSNNALTTKVRSLLKDFSFAPHKFKERTNAVVEVEAEIDQINEVGCLISSPVKFSPNHTIDIQSKLFKELEMDQCRYMVLEDFGRTPSGYYRNEVSFVGIQEKSSSKIRALRRES